MNRYQTEVWAKQHFSWQCWYTSGPCRTLFGAWVLARLGALCLHVITPTDGFPIVWAVADRWAKIADGEDLL